MAGRLAERAKWLLRSSILRLSLLLSAVFAIGMALAIFAALTIGEAAIERRVDSTLEALAQSAELEEADERRGSVIVRAPSDLRDLPAPFANVVRRGGGTVELPRDFRNSDTWRVLVARDIENDPIVIAVPIEDSEDALELLAGILWSAAALVIFVSLAIGLGVGLLVQRRLVRINGTLNRLAQGDLTARTGRARARDDLDDIARQLDTTAGELERLVAQTRHLSASLAHDLRTPLARLRARLEMLPDGDERGAALEEAERLSGIFDTIMRVARIEAAQGQDGFAPVDLGALATELAETFSPVLEDNGKALRLDLERPSVVHADRQMLVQALANLIQNALIHGGDDVTLFAAGQSVGVADTGPGVDPAQFDEILKPMVRLDAARGSEGTGLGLALVRAVADRHGVQLRLSPETPQGLRVTLNFANL